MNKIQIYLLSRNLWYFKFDKKSRIKKKLINKISKAQ